MKKYIYLVLFSLCTFILAACSSSTSNDGSSNESGEKITLSYAFFEGANTFPAKQMEYWKEEVEKRTDGKVEVELFYGGTLLQANNMYDGVKNKVADIGLSVVTYEPGRFPLLDISALPSGYPNGEVASLVNHDLVMEYPPEALKDTKIITAFATEPHFIQSRYKISNLDEMKGQQLRISGALAPVLATLGASPVATSQAEVAQAVQTGVIDGNVSSREVLMDLKLSENLKYVTDLPLTVATFVAVMNQDTWNSLPEDVQKVIDEVSHDTARFAGSYLDSHVKEALQWSIEEQNLEVVPLTDKDAWDAKLMGIQDELVEKLEAEGLPAKEYQTKLYELVEKYSNE